MGEEGREEAEQGRHGSRAAPKVRKVPIAFSDDLYEWLRHEAFRRRGHMADIVREALTEYRERTTERAE